MMKIAMKFAKALGRLRRDEKGAATVELVLVFPFFFAVFVSAFEVAIMNMRAVMLERATDIVVRDIRLGGGSSLDYDSILENVCALAGIIPDCVATTRIELQPVDTDTWAGLSASVDCIKRDEDIQPVIKFHNGIENELMLMRVCSIVDPIFPTVGVGRSMPLDSSGGYQIIASTAFVNEPN